VSARASLRRNAAAGADAVLAAARLLMLCLVPLLDLLLRGSLRREAAG